MKEDQKKTQFIIFRIIGVFVAILLIAGIAFSAFRFGVQRGLLAATESAATSVDIEDTAWAVPFFYWHRFSILGDLLMICVAIFLMRVVVGLIFGPRPFMGGHPYRHWHHRRWCGAYPYDPYAVPKDKNAASATQAEKPESL